MIIKISIEDEKGSLISEEARRGDKDMLHNVEWNEAVRELIDGTDDKYFE